MSPQYYIPSDTFSMFKSSTTQKCVILCRRGEAFKLLYVQTQHIKLDISLHEKILMFCQDTKQFYLFTQEPEENLYGCARGEPFLERKRRDMFSFLLSKYRILSSKKEDSRDEDVLHKSQRFVLSGIYRDIVFFIEF